MNDDNKEDVIKKHLTNRLVEKVCERLWVAQGSLKGMSGLFVQCARDPSFDDEEVYGIGQLLGKISEELGILEDILKSGQDSMADKRNGVDKDEKCVKDNENKEECDG